MRILKEICCLAIISTIFIGHLQDSVSGLQLVGQFRNRGTWSERRDAKLLMNRQPAVGYYDTYNFYGLDSQPYRRRPNVDPYDDSEDLPYRPYYYPYPTTSPPTTTTTTTSNINYPSSPIKPIGYALLDSRGMPLAYFVTRSYQ